MKDRLQFYYFMIGFCLHFPPQLELICTDLMNPRCYFANTEKESGPSPKHTIDVPNLEVKHQKGAVVIADSRDTIPLTASDLQDLSIDKFPTRKPAVLKIKGTEEGESKSPVLYNFCVLADENNMNIYQLAHKILLRLEEEKVDGQDVKGYWMPRDALPAMPVFDSTIDSIRKSQFILILLDPGNISVWMKRQIDLSLKIMLQSRMDSVIPIYLRDPANPQEKDNIPMGLQILKGLKYIKNDLDNEALFWKELGKAVIGREI